MMNYSEPGEGANGKGSERAPQVDKSWMQPKHMEIDTSRNRRWLGWVAYVLFYLLVTTLLVVLFVKFTGSLPLALALVIFMVAYMTIMGWLASRRSDRKE